MSLGGTYGYRLLRYLGFEAGVLTAIHPTGIIRGANFSIDPKDDFTWVHFGPRFILPLWGGRLELSAGAGGTYERYSVGHQNTAIGLAPRSGWGGNLSVGAAMALDRGRRFWLGSTPRWMLINTNSTHDRWFVVTGDVSFRF